VVKIISYSLTPSLLFILFYPDFREKMTTQYNKFIGLVIEQDNQKNMIKERVEEWMEQISVELLEAEEVKALESKAKLCEYH